MRLVERDLDFDGPPPDDLTRGEVARKLLHDLRKQAPFIVGGWIIGLAIGAGLTKLLGLD